MSTEDRKDGRPDPDALLAQVQQEEQARQRGRLKIFFGAAPGVGKTYAMLRYGQQEMAKGVNLFLMQLGEVVFGGVGSGLATFLAFMIFFFSTRAPASASNGR